MAFRLYSLTPVAAIVAMLATAVVPSVPGLDVHVSISLSARGMRWGLWEPAWQQSDGSLDFTQFTHAESELSHHADLVHWYASWSENWSYDGPLAQQVVSSGRTPFITWEANGRSLQQIGKGDYDGYITSWAQGMARMAPSPVYLRIFHEFNDPYQGNGSGYTWGDNGGTGNTPTDLIAAWRHIHDLFAAARAGNVRFVWCPDGANASLDVLRASYPGDTYVDFAGWDQYGYDINQVYTTLGQVTQKPLIVPEYGETSASAVGAWSDSLNAGRYDRVKAVVWFDDMGWRLDTMPDVRTAVQQMLATSAFAAPPPSPSPAPSASPSP